MSSRWMWALVALQLVTLIAVGAAAYGIGESVANARAADALEHATSQPWPGHGADLEERLETIESILETEVAAYRAPGYFGAGSHAGLSDRLDEIRTAIAALAGRLDDLESDLDTLCRASETWCP